MLGHHGLETVGAHQARTDARQGRRNEGDGVETLLDQMRGGQPARLHIVQAHEVEVGALDAAVDQHDGHARLLQVGRLDVASLRVDDQPFHAVRAQRGKRLAFALFVIAGIT
ncbi:hypothetical protein D3C87_1022420 [compost metagenome]